MQAARDIERLADLVDPGHPLSVRIQCELLGVSRSSIGYERREPSPETIELRRALDKIYMIDPCVGSRRLPELLLRDFRLTVNRKRIQRLRREMGLETIYCKPRTSVPGVGHRIFPYLLKKMEIESADLVWCADITYVPMNQGHAYLCAVMDWYSRKVMAWTLSNTMESEMCVRTLTEALKLGRPKIMNTDQGSQFTGEQWLGKLEEFEVTISMDGKGRYLDNVFIERLWRSVKYEEIYLRSHANILEQENALTHWFDRYNNWRPHQIHQNKTPHEIYSLSKLRIKNVLPKGVHS